MLMGPRLPPRQCTGSNEDAVDFAVSSFGAAASSRFLSRSRHAGGIVDLGNFIAPAIGGLPE